MNTQTITLAQLATACQNAAYINVHLYKQLQCTID